MLRVSTYSFYRSGELALVERQRDVLDIQVKISSGKRINSPADDPIGAGDAAAARSSISQFEQFRDNQSHARYLLNLGETALGEFVTAVQDANEKLIAAGNGSYSNAERRAIAADLRGQLNRMIGLANSADGAGGYLFAGSREAAAPFTATDTAVTFRGDDTLQRLEVSQDRFQQVKYAGDALFLKMRPGNGTFTTAAAAANTGSGSIDIGAVTNPSLLTGSAYAVNFTVAAGVTSYQVVRASDSAVVTSGNYASPTTIDFDGQRVTVQGAPANGDRFDIAPAGYRSIFDTMAAAIATLERDVDTLPQRARFNSELGSHLGSLDQALMHLGLKRAEFGTQLAELDAYEGLNDGRQLEHQTRLSRIEDLDIAQAAAELTRRQITHEAAIRSYSAVSRLSLFNFLS